MENGIGVFIEVDDMEMTDDKKQSVDDLRDLVKMQCSNGNWDYDEYMHGMANGMLLALSLFEVGNVEFFEAPEVWGKDRSCVGNATTQISGATNNEA